MTSIQAEDKARPEGSVPIRSPRAGPKTLSATLGASRRTGVATVVADNILDEGVIRALAEAVQLFPAERRA